MCPQWRSRHREHVAVQTTERHPRSRMDLKKTRRVYYRAADSHAASRTLQRSRHPLWARWTARWVARVGQDSMLASAQLCNKSSCLASRPCTLSLSLSGSCNRVQPRKTIACQHILVGARTGRPRRDPLGALSSSRLEADTAPLTGRVGTVVALRAGLYAPLAECELISRRREPLSLDCLTRQDCLRPALLLDTASSRYPRQFTPFSVRKLIMMLHCYFLCTTITAK